MELSTVLFTSIVLIAGTLLLIVGGSYLAYKMRGKRTNYY